MAWPQSIERWRKLVSWECKDIPVDLVLSLINQESGGVPGIKSRVLRERGCAEIPTGTGDEKTNVCHDLGLMQAGPATILFYLDNTGEAADLRDLTGTDERAARMQIRIGCWYFAWLIRTLAKYDPGVFARTPGQATPDQIKIALYAYNKGWGGGTKPKLDKLREARQSLTFAHMAAMFPRSRGLRYAETVCKNYRQHAEDIAQVEIAKSNAFAPGGKKKGLFDFDLSSLKNWLVPIGLLVAAYYFRVSGSPADSSTSSAEDVDEVDDQADQVDQVDDSAGEQTAEEAG